MIESAWATCTLMVLLGFGAATLSRPGAGPPPRNEYTCSLGCVATTAITCYQWKNNGWVEISNDDVIDYDDNDGGPWEVNGACHCSPQCTQNVAATNGGKCKVGARIGFEVTVASYKRIQGGTQPQPSAAGTCESLAQGGTVEVLEEACGTDVTVWILTYSQASCAVSSAHKYLVKLQLRCTDCNGTCPSDPI